MRSADLDANPFGGDFVADEILGAELADLRNYYWEITDTVGKLAH